MIDHDLSDVIRCNLHIPWPSAPTSWEDSFEASCASSSWKVNVWRRKSPGRWVMTVMTNVARKWLNNGWLNTGEINKKQLSGPRLARHINSKFWITGTYRKHPVTWRCAHQQFEFQEIDSSLPSNCLSQAIPTCTKMQPIAIVGLGDAGRQKPGKNCAAPVHSQGMISKTIKSTISRININGWQVVHDTALLTSYGSFLK